MSSINIDVNQWEFSLNNYIKSLNEEIKEYYFTHNTPFVIIKNNTTNLDRILNKYNMFKKASRFWKIVLITISLDDDNLINYYDYMINEMYGRINSLIGGTNNIFDILLEIKFKSTNQDSIIYKIFNKVLAIKPNIDFNKILNKLIYDYTQTGSYGDLIILFHKYGYYIEKYNNKLLEMIIKSNYNLNNNYDVLRSILMSSSNFNNCYFDSNQTNQIFCRMDWYCFPTDLKNLITDLINKKSYIKDNKINESNNIDNGSLNSKECIENKFNFIVNENSQLKEQIEKLLCEKNDLVKDNKNILDKNIKLMNDLKNECEINTKLYNTIKTLHQQISTSNDKYDYNYDKLYVKYKNILNKYNDLVGKYDELYDEYNELSDECDDLCSQRDDLSNECDNLSNECDILLDKYEVLLNKLDLLCTQSTNKDKECEKLQIENNSLKLKVKELEDTIKNILIEVDNIKNAN